MGGGSSMLTGGDPLKGALVGGLTGAVGGGLGGAPTGELAGSTLGANPTAAQVGTQLGVQGTATGAGSQAAMLADQMAGFGREGLTGLQSAAQTAIPSGTLPSSAVTAMGSPVAQATIPGTEGIANLAKDPTAYIKAHPYIAGASALTGAQYARRGPPELEKYKGPLSRFRFDPDKYRRSWASGGIADLNTGGYNRVIGEPQSYQPMARGGISDLGTYSDGGRMLRGRGDGMSDSIPGVIAGRRPARLADGEFVVPADVVSHLGNGSTDAGAKQLYSMMDRVRQARTGRRAQGRQINPAQFMPRRA
jgi:hypothetical protein